MTEYVPKNIISYEEDTDAVICLNWERSVEYTNFSLTYYYNDSDMDNDNNLYIYNSVMLIINKDPEYYTEATYYKWEAGKFFELLDDERIEIYPKKYMKRINKMIKAGEINRNANIRYIPRISTFRQSD